METKVKLRAPADTSSFSVAGVEQRVENGFVLVEGHVAKILTGSHGFTSVGEPEDRHVAATAPAGSIAIPRATIVAICKSLGVVVPGGFTDDRLVAVLVDAASRQDDRVAEEVKAAEERVLATLAEEVKKAEERVLATLAEKPKETGHEEKQEARDHNHEGA